MRNTPSRLLRPAVLLGTALLALLPSARAERIKIAVAQLFQNYGADDLRPGPLAVNHGLLPESVPSVDLAGSPRLVGSAIDIGCYEAPVAGTILYWH